MAKKQSIFVPCLALSFGESICGRRSVKLIKERTGPNAVGLCPEHNRMLRKRPIVVKLGESKVRLHPPKPEVLQ